MTHAIRSAAAICAVALSTVFAPLAEATTKRTVRETFGLTRAVPSDVFLVTAGKHNSERDFLNAHWARVWEAFEETGVMESLVDLAMSDVPAEAKGEIERVQGRCAEVFGAIDWTALGAGEVVFAQRMGGLLRHGNDVFGAPPEMVVLFQSERDAAAKHHASLVAVLQLFVDELNHFAQAGWALSKQSHDDLETSTLNLLQSVGEGSTMPITIGRHGDVVFLSFGESLTADVVGLLTGAAQGAVSETDRFQSAFDGLPSPEDGIEYFDMHNLTGGLRSMFTSIVQLVDGNMGRDPNAEPSGMAPTGELSIVSAVVERLMTSMEVIDTTATVHYTEGSSTWAESLTKLAPDAESNPLYPVIAAGGTVDDFARFLPAETGAFNVRSGTSLDALYTYLLDTVRSVGEPGEGLLVMWDGMQQQYGFDVRRDITSWIEGTAVDATFELDGREAWVSLMKVNDEQAASEKLALGLGFVAEQLPLLAKENPMLAMFQMRSKPTEGEDLVGFTDVAIGPMPEAAAVGVRDGWLVVGSNANAVRRVLATAAGEHPNVRENEALMAQAVVPEGAAQAVTFTDHGDSGEAAAGMVAAMSMAGGMVTMAIPDEQAREAVLQVMEIVSELAPVVEEIDFYDTSAATVTFDGKGWHSKSVTHYVPLEG